MRTTARFTLRLIPLIFMVMLPGCGTLPNGREWGQDVSLKPEWARVQTAAVRAATDPGTWVPAAGASLFLVGDADRRVSDWAVEHKPLFGDDPGLATDRLRSTVNSMMYGTALLAPSGSEPGDWVRNKLRGVGVEAFTGVVATNITGVLKRTVRRREPTSDPPRYESFTSAHATLPFADAALVRRNTAQLNWAPWGRHAVNTAALVGAAGSAWGRVEMGLHYPSDQLAGAAIGNFLGLFIHDIFMGLDERQFSVQVRPDGGGLSWGMRY